MLLLPYFQNKKGRLLLMTISYLTIVYMSSSFFLGGGGGYKTIRGTSFYYISFLCFANFAMLSFHALTLSLLDCHATCCWQCIGVPPSSEGINEEKQKYFLEKNLNKTNKKKFFRMECFWFTACCCACGAHLTCLI